MLTQYRLLQARIIEYIKENPDTSATSIKRVIQNQPSKTQSAIDNLAANRYIIQSGRSPYNYSLNPDKAWEF